MKLTRKLLGAVGLVAVLAAVISPTSLEAQRWSSPVTTIVSAVGGTTTGTYPATPTTGIDTSQASAVLVHVYSASTSSATIYLEQSVNGSGWYRSVTISNPTSVGELWACPAANKLRVNLAVHASGTITAVASTRLMSADPIGSSCKKVDVSANTFGALSVTSLTNSGLTSGRVPYSGSGGLQADEAAFAYNAGTNTLSADTFSGAFNGTTVTASSLTDTRVPYATTAGLLTDEAALSYAAASNTLSAGVFKGGAQFTANAYANDGAISVAPQLAMLTKAGVGAYTLAAPTSTTHDGYMLCAVSTTANAHVITFASGKINGGSNVTITLGGAIADGVCMAAYNGVWWTLSGTNFTVAP